MYTRESMNAFDDAAPELYAVAYRVAFRMLGNRHDAEEIAQEICARALMRWATVEPYAPAWAARTASNLVIDSHRRSRRWLPGVPEVGMPADGERVDLVRALRSLPRRQRDVVVLRYLADLSEQDVADRLGCSLGSVKQHAHRGLAALRAAQPAAGGT